MKMVGKGDSRCNPERQNTVKYCPQCGSNLVDRDVDGEPRQVCSDENCTFVFWNNPVPVVAALVELDGDYIIARNRSWPRGIFSVITGYLEQGELPEDAVIREVSEELGLQGTITRFIGNYMFKEKNQLIVCYEVSASGTIETNQELAELKRLSRKELSNYDFRPLYITEQIIRDWKN
ncbi:MAG: NUDIX domain-containing protein [Acidiferrobacterales bacterium]